MEKTTRFVDNNSVHEVLVHNLCCTVEKLLILLKTQPNSYMQVMILCKHTALDMAKVFKSCLWHANVEAGGKIHA
jgi:hypothetical protein